MNSIWYKTVDLPKFRELGGDIHTDVLIIGGGMAGILTAYFLQKAGVNYILVEKGRICSGITGNTTAKITIQHGLIFDKILKSSGTEAAKKYLSVNKAALDKYEELCKNSDCDYEIKDNYVYSIDNRKKLENEIRALDKIGYNAELCERTELPLKIAGAVKFANQAQFNPLKFIGSIAGKMNIYENTFVREMVGNTVITDSGKISADRVIVTTHFPFINKHGSYYIKLYQHRSYVIALENAQKLSGMYVDENKKGLSFRNYNDLLLLGGGGHRTGEKGGCWEEIRRFAKIKYPSAREVCHWAAQDCMSLDGIPYIGRYSKNTHELYTASGFNKWGMTGSMVSAMLLSDMVTGRKNEYEDIFSPSRSMLNPQLFINGIKATLNVLTISKKRCPHLGCALKWNNAEHSWDCACHGSRFDESGKLLDNPSNGDLPQRI